MDTVYRKDRDREGEGTLEIQSFSTPGKTYLVADTGCECPHSRIQGAMCRHRLLFGCLTRIRKSAFGTRNDERVARDLVASVLDKKTGIERSYSLAMECEFFRFSSPELRQIAWERHRVNVAREAARLERTVA